MNGKLGTGRMKCVICQYGDANPGTATVTVRRESLTLVVKEVPALVCDNCVDEYVEDQVTAQIIETAQEALDADVQVDVRY